MRWLRGLIAIFVLACPPAAPQLRMLLAETEETTHEGVSSSVVRHSEERQGTARPPPPSPRAALRHVALRLARIDALLRRAARTTRRAVRIRRRVLYGGPNPDDDA